MDLLSRGGNFDPTKGNAKCIPEIRTWTADDSSQKIPRKLSVRPSLQLKQEFPVDAVICGPEIV
jgi:hypothetical protein